MAPKISNLTIFSVNCIVNRTNCVMQFSSKRHWLFSTIASLPAVLFKSRRHFDYDTDTRFGRSSLPKSTIRKCTLAENLVKSLILFHFFLNCIYLSLFVVQTFVGGLWEATIWPVAFLCCSTTCAVLFMARLWRQLATVTDPASGALITAS